MARRIAARPLRNRGTIVGSATSEGDASQPAPGGPRAPCSLLSVLAVLALACRPAARAQAPLAAPDRPRPLHGHGAAAPRHRSQDAQRLRARRSRSVRGARPGRIPFARMRYEYTWYVRDGMHVRSPLKFNGVPIGEIRAARLRGALGQERGRPPQVPHRAREQARAGRQGAGDGRALDQRAALHLRVLLPGLQVRARQLLPRRQGDARRPRGAEDRLPADAAVQRRQRPRPTTSDSATTRSATGARRTRRSPRRRPDTRSSEAAGQGEGARRGHRSQDEQVLAGHAVGRSGVAPDRQIHVRQRVARLPARRAGWCKVDDLRASMQMGQPFPGVWLPHNISIHAGVSLALGPMELTYKREFSNYRKADVSSKITRAEDDRGDRRCSSARAARRRCRPQAENDRRDPRPRQRDAQRRGGDRSSPGVAHRRRRSTPAARTPIEKRLKRQRPVRRGPGPQALSHARDGRSRARPGRPREARRSPPPASRRARSAASATA